MASSFVKAQQWECFAEAARYNANELAKLCQLSSRELRRQLQRILGRSPQDLLDEKRIFTAKELLLTGQSVKQVAFCLKYKQASHFCRQFKARTKMTPSEFCAWKIAADRIRKWKNGKMSATDNKCPSQITAAG